MDIYSRRVAELNASLPRNVRIVRVLPQNIDPRIHARIRGGAAGWFDEHRGCVTLYGPNLSGKADSIDSTVAFLHVSRKGLQDFLGTSDYKLLCCRISRMVNGAGASSFSLEESFRFGDGYLHSLGDNHDRMWDDIASCVSEITGLKDSYSLAESLCKGHARFMAYRLKEAAKNNDTAVLAEHMAKGLTQSADSASRFSLGHAADVFLRLGYPDADVNVSVDIIRNFAEANGVSLEFLSSGEQLFSIHQPLAVVRERRSRVEGRQPLTTFITDNFVQGKGYLSFSVEALDEVRKGFVSGKYRNIKVRAIRFYSEYSLMQALGAENGGRICYLQPKHGVDGTSYRVSDILAGLDGRSAESMGYKKGADGMVPGITPSQLSRRLIITANIVENFRNPMSAAKRMELFGKNKFEQDMEHSNSSLPLRKERLETQPVRKDPRTYAERLKTYVSDEYFSKGAMKKLAAAHILTASDLISVGSEKFRQDFGTRVFKSAERFLEANGLGFGNTYKLKVISTESLSRMTSEQQEKVRETDLINSLSYVPDSVMSRQLRMPRDVDGRYFMGADAVNLVARSVSTPRWRDSNIFLSAEEMKRFGLTPAVSAIPCHVMNAEGKSVVVYNLSETDFASRHPSMFDAMAELSRSTSAEVPAYMRNIIYGYAGVKPSEASRVFDIIDGGCRRTIARNQLGADSLTLSQLSSQAARKVGIRNPLETRGRKPKASEVYGAMCSQDMGPRKSSGRKK